VTKNGLYVLSHACIIILLSKQISRHAKYVLMDNGRPDEQPRDIIPPPSVVSGGIENVQYISVDLHSFSISLIYLNFTHNLNIAYRPSCQSCHGCKCANP